MIVFVDIQQQKINVIDDQNLYVFDATDLDGFAQFVGNRKVVYVTEYIETTGVEVLRALGGLNMHDQDTDSIDVAEQKMYLHVTHPYKTYIEFEGREYIFAGKHDAKALDSLPENILTDCDTIVKGLKSGIFAIIDEEHKNALEKERNNSPLGKLRKSVAQSRVQDIASNKGGLDDPIEIDLGGSASFKRDK